LEAAGLSQSVLMRKIADHVDCPSHATFYNVDIQIDLGELEI
jgi:hypothetical protein